MGNSSARNSWPNSCTHVFWKFWSPTFVCFCQKGASLVLHWYVLLLWITFLEAFIIVFEYCAVNSDNILIHELFETGNA